MSTCSNGMVIINNNFFIINLFVNDKYFLLFISMEGGELFQRIQDRQEGAFTERGKENIFFCMISNNM